MSQTFWTTLSVTDFRCRPLPRVDTHMKSHRGREGTRDQERFSARDRLALSNGMRFGRPFRRRSGPALAVYASYGLTAQDLAMEMFSVGESRQCSPCVTCAESTNSITTHSLHRGCTQHAILECVARVLCVAYCTSMR